jgi:arylsulfatase A-like enzyme
VPLIVHLPAALAERYAGDPAAPAYTADITPTLYALLGHDTTAPGRSFGTPLFWPKGGRRPARTADGALVASSYGSVYGWLGEDARRLYVSDGVSLRDYRYELDGSPTGRALPVGPDDRRRGQAAVREALADIARFYKIEPPR